MNKNSKIFIAGHRGLVGSAIVKTLQSQGFNNLVLRARDELDLMNQSAVLSFFENKKPEYVFLAAAKVGGIFANNTFPAEFIYNNLTIQNNIIHASYLSGVKRLLFLGSSCIYPRECPQPMKEEHLLTGPLEATNRPYAVAKIAGIEMCWSYNRQYNTKYFAVMPTNLFGPNDNFDLKNSHVIPALIRKCHEAKTQGFESVEVWGTGRSRREFLYSEDMAEACVYFMNLSDRELEPVVDPNNCPLINVGVGEDIGIADLAQEVQKTVGFRGQIVFNTSMPDGTPRKLLDVTLAKKLGWQAKTSLNDGLKFAYEAYLASPKG